jgi:hypothetical protein
VYGLGRISNRGIFVLCVVLFCVAQTALNIYLLLHAEADVGQILPYPGHVVEKHSVKKPGFAVYGRNVSVSPIGYILNRQLLSVVFRS